MKRSRKTRRAAATTAPVLALLSMEKSRENVTLVSSDSGDELFLLDSLPVHEDRFYENGYSCDACEKGFSRPPFYHAKCGTDCCVACAKVLIREAKQQDVPTFASPEKKQLQAKPTEGKSASEVDNRAYRTAEDTDWDALISGCLGSSPFPTTPMNAGGASSTAGTTAARLGSSISKSTAKLRKPKGASGGATVTKSMDKKEESFRSTFVASPPEHIVKPPGEKRERPMEDLQYWWASSCTPLGSVLLSTPVGTADGNLGTKEGQPSTVTHLFPLPSPQCHKEETKRLTEKRSGNWVRLAEVVVGYAIAGDAVEGVLLKDGRSVLKQLSKPKGDLLERVFYLAEPDQSSSPSEGLPTLHREMIRTHLLEVHPSMTEHYKKAWGSSAFKYKPKIAVPPFQHTVREVSASEVDAEFPWFSTFFGGPPWSTDAHLWDAFIQWKQLLHKNEAPAKKISLGIPTCVVASMSGSSFLPQRRIDEQKERNFADGKVLLALSNSTVQLIDFVMDSEVVLQKGLSVLGELSSNSVMARVALGPQQHVDHLQTSLIDHARVLEGLQQFCEYACLI